MTPFTVFFNEFYTFIGVFQRLLRIFARSEEREFLKDLLREISEFFSQIPFSLLRI